MIHGIPARKRNEEKRVLIDAMEKAGFQVIDIAEGKRDYIPGSYAIAKGPEAIERTLIVTIAPTIED